LAKTEWKIIAQKGEDIRTKRRATKNEVCRKRTKGRSGTDIYISGTEVGDIGVQ